MYSLEFDIKITTFKHTHANTVTLLLTLGIWHVFHCCFLFSFYCSSERLREMQTSR